MVLHFKGALPCKHPLRCCKLEHLFATWRVDPHLHINAIGLVWITSRYRRHTLGYRLACTRERGREVHQEGAYERQRIGSGLELEAVRDGGTVLWIGRVVRSAPRATGTSHRRLSFSPQTSSRPAMKLGGASGLIPTVVMMCKREDEISD